MHFYLFIYNFLCCVSFLLLVSYRCLLVCLTALLYSAPGPIRIDVYIREYNISLFHLFFVRAVVSGSRLALYLSNTKFLNFFLGSYLLFQAKKMFEPTRLIATSIYFFMMSITLFLVFYPGNIPLRLLYVIIAIFLQFVALVWYTLSFIPFAREIVTQCCKNTCCQV